MASLRVQVDDLRTILDTVESLLEESYRPEASREELAAAIGEALETMSPEGGEDEDDESRDGTDDEEL